jgi:hypothetical protein
VGQRVPGHVLQLGERLDARVPAAHEGEGQRPRADLRVVGGTGGVEPGEHVVAQVDGLAHVLEPDTVLGQPGDRQRPGHRARRHHQDVVGQVERLALAGGDAGPLLGVGQPGHRPGDHPAPVQGAAQGDHHVPRLHGARGGLGQEGLVGHVRLRVDDDDLRPAPGELPLQPQGRVEADVPAPDHEDHRALHGGDRGGGAGCGLGAGELAPGGLMGQGHAPRA